MVTTDLRAQIAREATIELTCEPELVPIKGNCSASDPVQDRKTERWIERQLEKGNQWAWCSARVRGTWRGLTADDYLGCCSYLGEEDFRTPGGYFDDMVDAVLDSLTEQAEAIRAD